MKVLAFLGPESTGKTSSALAYSTKNNAYYVEEFARSYLKEIGLNYSESDILRIAKAQIELEKNAILNHADRVIVLDTELITIQIWLEFYDYTVPSWIIDHIQSSDYDYWLFNTDLPWVADGLRNNPNDRNILFKLFEKKLIAYQKRYKIVENLDALDII